MKITLKIKLEKGYLCKDISKWSWYEIKEGLEFLFNIGLIHKEIIITSDEDLK